MRQELANELNQELLQQDEATPTLGMHPKKFILWLVIVSIIMIFASLTSAYIVRKGEGNWLEFVMPPVFWWSTASIVLSSVTLQWSVISAAKKRDTMLRFGLVLTFVLGCVFSYLQWESWKYLVNIGVYLVGNPSGSFVYIITGVHIFHLVTGMIWLLISLIKAFRPGYFLENNAVQLEMSATYWHFLGGLWVYLFIFLLTNS